MLCAGALAIGGCSKPAADPLDTLDARLVDTNGASAAADPALTAALQDQIMVDPQLVGQANGDAVRPPAQPYAAPIPPDIRAKEPEAATAEVAPLSHAPAASASCTQCAVARQALTLAALAQRQPDKAIAGCGGRLRYSAAWAQRLPRDLPLYADAQVGEAAGTDEANCGVRVVSFASAASTATLLDFYYTHATGGGFSAGHQADGTEHVLAGTRKDGRAFLVYVNPRPGGGSDVDLLTNAGS